MKGRTWLCWAHHHPRLDADDSFMCWLCQRIGPGNTMVTFTRRERIGRRLRKTKIVYFRCADGMGCQE